MKLTFDVPISETQVGDVKLPYLKLSDWCKMLIGNGLWHHLAGLREPDPERTSAIWREFWARYRLINPSHEIYKRTDIDLGSVCAMMLHGDEGRSQKKAAILVLAAHSILGFGLRTSKVPKNERLSMNLNYESPTWTTRFLLAVAPRWVYADDDDQMQDIMRAISIDLKALYDEGLPGPDGKQVYFCPLAMMGDWPFIAKCGGLGRSFWNVSKHANARSEPKGICHRCQADRRGWLWEDFEVATPPWLLSENTLSPFTFEPAVLMLPMDKTNTPKFFAWDLFHAWHLGAGKSFMATAFVLLCMSSIYFGSIDSRIEKGNADFMSWCKANNMRPYIRRLSKENLGWQQTSNFPSGGWSKGETTRVLTKFFLHQYKMHAASVQDDVLLTIAYKAAGHINTVLSGLYKWELWIPSSHAEHLGLKGIAFLRMFGRGAQKAALMKKSFFYLLPNLHRLHHIFWDMLEDSGKSPWVLNPLYAATQPEEDFIGRPSRISRKVNPRTVVLRTIQRSLITAHAKYREAGLIRDAT